MLFWLFQLILNIFLFIKIMTYYSCHVRNFLSEDNQLMFFRCRMTWRKIYRDLEYNEILHLHDGKNLVVVLASNITLVHTLNTNLYIYIYIYMYRSLEMLKRKKESDNLLIEKKNAVYNHKSCNAWIINVYLLRCMTIELK